MSLLYDEDDYPVEEEDDYDPNFDDFDEGWDFEDPPENDVPFCVECGDEAYGGGQCGICWQPMCDGCIEMCMGVCNQHDEEGKPLLMDYEINNGALDSIPLVDGAWACKHADGPETTLRETSPAGWERIVCPDCGTHWVIWENTAAGRREAMPVIVPVGIVGDDEERKEIEDE